MAEEILKMSKNEEIFIGYVFVFFIIKPIILLFWNFFYDRYVFKITFFRIIKIKVKKIYKKYHYFIDLLTLLNFFFIFSFIFPSFQNLYFKISEKILTFFYLFFYRFLLNFFPYSIVYYYRIKNSFFIQKIINYFNTEYVEKDEEILFCYLKIIFLSCIEFLLFFLLIFLFLIGTISLGNDFPLCFSEIKKMYQLKYNFFAFLKNLYFTLNFLIMKKIQDEIACWNKTKRLSSRVFRIIYWVTYLFIIFSYFKFFVNLLNQMLNSYSFPS